MNRFLMFLAAVVPFSCSSDFKTLDTGSFESAIRNKDVQLVDVRTPDEYSKRRIPNSINIDIYNASFIDSAIVRLDKNKPVAVYCRSGKRSTTAATALVRAGFKDVLNLQGGIFSWITSGKAVCDNADYIVFDGEAAPDFDVEIFDSAKMYPDGYTGQAGQGKRLRLSDLKGKVVMLQFTASWCGVCRAEMPQIEAKIWQKHKSNPDFVLLAIDRDEDAAKILQAIKATEITYPIAFDANAEVYDRFAVHDSGITRNVLVGRDGKIVMRTRLYNQKEFSALTAKIDSLLAE